MTNGEKVFGAVALVAAAGAALWFALRSRPALGSGYLPGDVNGDGRVDVTDYLLASRIANEQTNPVTGADYPADWKARADLNQDGFVTEPDIQQIESVILGLG